MDSITKLRGKLAEAENLLQYVSKELESYSTKDAEEHLNFAELKLRGEQYSFYEHPLTGKLFRDDYLALLIYLISLGGKKEEGWTVLYRIAAGCDYQGELQNLTTDAMTFTEERLSDLIREIYAAELANIFAIDSLMISHHMGADDAQLKFLAGIYELLKLDKGFLSEAMEFVKVLDATYWDNPVGKSKAWKILTAKDIATYIGGTPAASLGEAAGINKKRVVIVREKYTSHSALDLDDWKPNEILFLNSCFENCGGIYSANKVVKFLSCSFDQNNFKRYKFDPPYSSATSKGIDYYRCVNNRNIECEDLYHFEDVTFANCTFKHFHDAVTFLYLGQGLISCCTFEDIEQYPAHCVLFNIKNAKVSNSKFINCHNSMATTSNVPENTDIHYSGQIISCMIYSVNTFWKSVSFTNCSNLFDESYKLERISYFSYVLLLSNQSKCQDCIFENVTTCIRRRYSRYGGGPYTKDHNETAVIGLHDSFVDNNEGATIANADTINLGRGSYRYYRY